MGATAAARAEIVGDAVTLSNYSSGLSAWRQFASQYAVTLPITSGSGFTGVLIAFMSWLFHVRGVAAATVRTYGWAVRDMHLRLCGRELTIQALWERALLWHRHHGRHAHAAKQPFQVHWLLALLPRAHLQPYVFAVAIGFIFLLRASEYLRTSPASPHCIRWRDVRVVHTAAGRSLVLRVPSSKTDATGHAVLLQRAEQPGDPLCPVALFLAHAAAHPSPPPGAPIMCLADGSHITQHNAAVVIKAAAHLAGADHRLYSCHSLRSGGATSLWLATRDAMLLLREGRWSSMRTMLRYCRIPPSIAATATGQMLSAPIPAGMDTYPALPPA